MGDLKETLGVKAPPPPVPIYDPPLAKAQANATEALVGSPISFLSDGTKDPQKLPLDYEWDFADGQRAKGAYATHAFAAPGEYGVKLYVTNLGGLTDEDVLLIRIAPLDRAPTAAIRVLGADGVATLRTTTNAPLTFDGIASDPEGAPLSYEWSFGDGATAHDASETHAYAKPGHYDARLKVTDRAGSSAASTQRIAVDMTASANGAFEPAGASQADTPVFVASTARSLAITLEFPAGAGLNDLEIVVLDANGEEIARSGEEPAPGAADAAARVLSISEFSAPGDWVVRVLRERGLAVEWTLDIMETVS